MLTAAGQDGDGEELHTQAGAEGEETLSLSSSPHLPAVLASAQVPPMPSLDAPVTATPALGQHPTPALCLLEEHTPGWQSQDAPEAASLHASASKTGSQSRARANLCLPRSREAWDAESVTQPGSWAA